MEIVENLSTHGQEIASGERFEFGENWSRFLALLNDERIAEAEGSLKRMLETDSLAGKSFVDIGSGSGLFSLAARRLGAKVRSFDFDPKSVACAQELKRRYFPDDLNWTINEASALDPGYLASLEQFDIVYSWGVLHHTGQMWTALDNAATLVKPDGKLFIAIYNDTGSQAARWLWIKRTYNKLPRFLRAPYAALMFVPEESKKLLSALAKGRPGDFVRSWTDYGTDSRGMNRWRDIIDWVGGYPYEYASVDAIFDFYKERGFTLVKIDSAGAGLGCNEFVFQRNK
jgi:2-polyprenyl-6-hydroxyphenyl methylase/3-demethylubiquinone-9 3-methyltransferase